MKSDALSFALKNHGADYADNEGYGNEMSQCESVKAAGELRRVCARGRREGQVQTGDGKVTRNHRRDSHHGCGHCRLTEPIGNEDDDQTAAERAEQLSRCFV